MYTAGVDFMTVYIGMLGLFCNPITLPLMTRLPVNPICGGCTYTALLLKLVG